MEDFFRNIYVPFDCKLMITRDKGNETGETIAEVYQIDRESMITVVHFGTWNITAGFKGPMTGLYQRRNNLHGRNLIVAIVYVSFILSGRILLSSFFQEDNFLIRFN